MITYLLFTCFISLVVTLGAIVALRPFAAQFGLIDQPAARKVHLQPALVIGGVSILLGIGLASLFLPISLAPYRSLIAGCVILVFIGVMDDSYDVNYKIRLGMQFLVSLLVAFWGATVFSHLGNLFAMGAIVLPYAVAIIVTLFIIVGIINAVNMTDGVDGLAATLIILQFVCFLILAIQTAQTTDIYFLSIIISALLGFLFFNFPFPGRKQASIFLGDAGSTLLGFLLAWFCVRLSQNSQAVVYPVVFAWILGTTGLDMLWSILRRLLRRESPFHADKEHLHHILLGLGLSPCVVVVVIGLISFLLGILGIIAYDAHCPEWVMLVGYVVVLLIYFALMAVLCRQVKHRSELHEG